MKCEKRKTHKAIEQARRKEKKGTRIRVSGHNRARTEPNRTESGSSRTAY